MAVPRDSRRLGIPAIMLALAAWAAGQSSCQPNGLYLGTSGGRLGDPWFVGVNGNPGGSGYLGADLAPGPSPSPIGNLCLGLTPDLQLVPFALDGSGAFSLAGILPADPALTGLTAFLQAAAADPVQPSGYAVSNGASLTLRPPRVFFVDAGDPTVYPIIPGAFCVYDCLTDAVVAPPVPIPGFVQGAVLVESLGWIAFLLSDGHLACYDANTGAQTLYQQLPVAPGGPFRLAAEGATLYVLYQGTSVLFGTNIPGALRSFSLPSGAAGFTWLFSSGLPGSGMPSRLMVLPGQGIGYVLFGTTTIPVPVASAIVPVDLVNGAMLPPIAMGGSSGPVHQWLRVGSIVHCLMPGFGPNPFGVPPVPGAIASIDTFTHTAVHPAPVLLPMAVTPWLTYGPGTAGSALFVRDNGGNLLQLDPSGLLVTATIAIPAPVYDMVLSPGGTEWLIYAGGPAPALHVMSPPALTLSPGPSLPSSFSNFTLLAAIPSPTIRRALFFSNGAAYPFSTDPTTALQAPVMLPGTMTGMIVD